MAYQTAKLAILPDVTEGATLTLAPPPATRSGPEWVRIRPSRGWRSLHAREVWSRRDLLFFFAWRDVKVRYKQTALGIVWAVLQPLLTMLLFGVLFNRIANVPSEGVNYHAFALTALVPWVFIQNSITFGSNTLVQNANLLGKIYFPRILMPEAAVAACLVDLAIALVMLMIFLPIFGVAPSIRMLLIPVIVAWAFLVASGFVLWLSALNVFYRDIKYVVPFLAQALLFATPIAYPTSLTSGAFRWAVSFDPVTGVVDIYRWVFLGVPLEPAVTLISSLSALALLITGVAYFVKMQRAFADIV